MRPTKEEVLAFIKPTPPTDAELAGLEKLEPGDYEIYSERLNMILTECKEVFQKVGNSDWVMSGDLIVGLHTAQGDMVSACLGTYIHSVTAQNPIKWIMQNFYDNPRVGVHNGDIFYCNEPTYGGLHNCDQLALMPIFHKGVLIAWASTGTHMDETGGIVPGGMIGDARTRYDEGMCLTPIKLAENFQIKEDIMEMIVNMIGRAGRQQVLDTRARCTGVDRLRMRIEQLAEQKGGDFVQGLLRKVMMVAEEGARNRVRRWNDGVYRNAVFMSGIGSRTGIWRIVCTATKEDDHVLLDYTGTSPENDSAFNCFPWTMAAYAALYLYSHGFWDLPVCSGTMAPIDYIFPDLTVISPAWNAAVSIAPPVGELNTQLLPNIFASMMFSDPEERLSIAAPQNQILGYGGKSMGGGMGGFGAGVNQWGVPVIGGGGGWTRNTGGQGARVDSDGMDSSIFRSAVHAQGSDGEEAENDQPTLHLWQKHRMDSGGNGKYRGGVSGHVGGIFYAVHSAPRRATTGGILVKKMLVGNGLFGGYPPDSSPGVSIENSNVLELMAKSDKKIPVSIEEIVTEQYLDGDYELPLEIKARPARIAYEGSLFAGGGPGGKGYGDVLERDPQSVVNDVQAELISEWTAHNVYHVEYDKELWLADEEKTAESRKKEREDRLKRGQPYDAFEEEWLKQKPADDQLHYYGSWPDARLVNRIIRM
ncbi:MAG: hydantoinase B/oxoprolinase family protein [Dehalococcoidales bacterium]|nr:hydantoinase B/oxoprolinase family protein [Dehalococcoidales bacterium]